MTHNHIIIGLGGTGGKIIRAFRKTIYRDFKQAEPKGVNVDYLYVDSSDEMMATDDPTWKILGESIQLKQANQLRLEGGSLASRLEDIHNYPGLSRWIGDKSNWGNILNIGSGAKILGGQKRRLGRFLFACHVEQFRTQVSEIVRRMTEGEAGEVTFHVCCGLAGGTGSGSLIDAIAQLRALYPEPRRYRILLYTLLPDRYPKATWNTGNYFANGYAALMELNALSVGVFRPYDITGRSERVDKVQDPFQACYLVTNDNENGLTLDVDREIPEIIAMFLYQKIVVTTGVNWGQLQKTEAFENRDLPPEGLDPAIGERSRLFIAFGLKQLSYPEEEITELLTFSFARQAALQLAYNNWSAAGFTDEASSLDPAAILNDAQTLARWKLSDAHLCLEQQILGPERNPEEKNWKNLNLEWRNFVDRLSNDIVSQTDRNWVSELVTQCQDRFDSKFRDCGVVAYYDGKLRNRDDYGREIRGAIEESLFSDWKDGRRSMRDTAVVLQQILESLRERRTHWAEKREAAQRLRDAALTKIQLNTTEWDDVGPLARMFGKQKEVFLAASDNAVDFYSNSSYIQAWQFAESLVNEVEGQLYNLKGRVDTAAALLRAAIERFGKSMDERCVAGSDEDLKKNVVRLYRAEEVHTIVKTLIRDKDAQILQTSRARQSVVEELLGNRATFRKLSELDKEQFIDHLEKVCLQSVTQAHGTMVEAMQGRAIRLLGVSMIDKLKERYASNPASMRTEVESVVKMAGSFLPISEAERQKSGIATSTGNLIKMMTIMLPAAPDEKGFVGKLKDEFSYASKDCAPDFIETASRRHEITIISLVHLFPLRFAELVAFLRQAYTDRLKLSDTEQAKMVLHLEGDGQQFPPLFVPTVKSLGMPLLVLGKATGLIVEMKDDTGATTSNALVTYDKDGLPKRLMLGRSYSDCLATLATANNLATLNSAVSSTLASNEFRSAERRQSAKEKIRQEVSACDPKDSASDMYESLVDGARTAIARIDAISPA